jgi:acetolactate decarboxylase
LKKNLLLCSFLAASFGLGADPAPSVGALFQYSTIDALSQGVFDGEASVAQLKAKGSFGLGTFNRLDGELVMLDGVAYQVPSSGKIKVAEDGQQVPFAAVVSATAERWQALQEAQDMASLQKALDTLAPSKNALYAFRVEGRFARVDTRSVPAQSQPYPSFGQAIKAQALFSQEGVQGTLVGLRGPDWIRGVNLPGYHFHFISADRSFGGHVLGCHLSQGKVSVVRLDDFHLQVPATPAFGRVELPITTVQNQALHKAESTEKK